MKISSAEFIKSAWNSSDYPENSLPEVAFVGRSNVGKSSLINVLVNRKKLVKTSSVPGKTQSINFFNINNSIMFVDLPGYGFAKVPLEVKKKWKPLVDAYLSTRKTLKLIVLILDIRRTPTPEDTQLLEWFDLHSIPSVIVLNKTDKTKKTQRAKQITLIQDALPSGEKRTIIPFSAMNKEGKGDVWKSILHEIDEQR